MARCAFRLEKKTPVLFLSSHLGREVFDVVSSGTRAMYAFKQRLQQFAYVDVSAFNAPLLKVAPSRAQSMQRAVSRWLTRYSMRNAPFSFARHGNKRNPGRGFVKALMTKWCTALTDRLQHYNYSRTPATHAPSRPHETINTTATRRGILACITEREDTEPRRRK